MSCQCASFRPLELSRDQILKRLRETKRIKKTLDVLVQDESEHVALYRCRDCGSFWQSGRQWGFGRDGFDEYLFQVPAISIEEWQREHYRQPAAMMVYSVAMSERYGWTPPPERDVQCEEVGCGRKAIRFSVHCLEHDIAHGRLVGSVPPEPRGRMFPPYETRPVKP